MYKTCVEIILSRIIAGIVYRIELSSPAAFNRTYRRVKVSSSVFVLKARKYERGHDLNSGRYCRRNFPGFAFFGSDYNGTIGSIGAIERRSRSSCQHGHRLYVVRVDVRNRVRRSLRREFRAPVPC